MNIFCDTSVLVAGSVRRHPHFAQAHAVLEAALAKTDVYFMSAHSVAETYSVLTNLPLTPKIVPAEARLIIEANVLACFKRVTVTPIMYERAVLRCAELGLSGGVVYDALLVECARSSRADRLLTFNTRDFQRLAPDWADRITAP